MNQPKFITIINDCKSENDVGRLKTRYTLLFPNTNINFVGVDSSLGINSTLEAAGNLIDILDSSEGKEGVIALNVAPRGQIKEDGVNGSNFSFFWYKNTLIVSTIKGYNLSFVKKLQLAESINILDTKVVLQIATDQKLIVNDLKEYIVNSQFRSLDFQPRVARWIYNKYKFPFIPASIEKFAEVPSAVWLIDSFGNAKTTMVYEDVFDYGRPELVSGPRKMNRMNNRSSDRQHDIKDKPLRVRPFKVSTNLGIFPYYERLKDVPDGVTAIYTGSSGIGDKRFLEIATQNRKGSAAGKLNLKIGDSIEIR